MTDAELVQKIRERLAVIDTQALADFDECSERYRKLAQRLEDSPTIDTAAPPAEAFDGDYIDSDGYPTEAALARIQNWPINNMDSDIQSLFDFIRSCAWEEHGSWHERIVRDRGLRFNRITVSTGGWSGNESLISALERNVVAWSLTWQSSKRGGHFVFEVRR